MGVLESFLCGVSERFGRAVGRDFALAGVESFDRSVVRFCQSWLEANRDDVTDAAPR